MEVGVIIGASIGVGSTTFAGWLASRRDDRIRREERTDARHSEVGLAMRNYLAAIAAIAAELPNDRPPLQPSAIDPWLDKLAKLTGLDFIAYIVGRLLQRAMFGKRPEQLGDRLADAAAHLRLIAPPEVERYMIEGEQLSRKYEPGNERWLEDWKDYTSRMRAGFRAALDRLGAQ
jgi:hypothetical protein